MANREYHCIVAETIERHYTVPASSKHDAAFKLAIAISADPPTMEPERTTKVRTATHISPLVPEDE